MRRALFLTTGLLIGFFITRVVNNYALQRSSNYDWLGLGLSILLFVVLAKYSWNKRIYDAFEELGVRRFNPLPANHPAVVNGLDCIACGVAFKAGDVTTLVGDTPADEEEARKKQQGREYIAVAALAHYECMVNEYSQRT